MYPSRFAYDAPTSLAEAIAILDASGGEAKILAGGQSLVPMLKLRFAAPERLVDINGIPGLDYHRLDADGTLAHVVERLFALSAEKAGFQIADTAGNFLASPPKPIVPWLPEGRWLPQERDWALQTVHDWSRSGATAPRITLPVPITCRSTMLATPTSMKISTFLKMPLKPTSLESVLSMMAHITPVT